MKFSISLWYFWSWLLLSHWNQNCCIFWREKKWEFKKVPKSNFQSQLIWFLLKNVSLGERFLFFSFFENSDKIVPNFCQLSIRDNPIKTSAFLGAEGSKICQQSSKKTANRREDSGQKLWKFADVLNGWSLSSIQKLQQFI